MPYAVINETPGDRDTFDQVGTMVPQEPEGLLALIHGTSERGYTVVSVWRSQADADRFFTEHLAPAISKLVGDPVPPPLTFIALQDVEMHTQSV
jgi:hypothetical protein